MGGNELELRLGMSDAEIIIRLGLVAVLCGYLYFKHWQRTRQLIERLDERPNRERYASTEITRWEKLKQKSEPTPVVVAMPKKRKLSAAGRKAIIAGTKKRWAKVKAAKKAA